jgi:basic amino acid/polyamine antiporter, APA family
VTAPVVSPAAAGEIAPVTELRRTLGLLDLTFIAIGTVIGSGIFLVPGVVLRETGTQTGPALLVWVAAGILSYLGALTYAEMGAMKPDAGGLYTYIRDAFGPLPAFLYGWTSFFVIASGSVATLAVAFSGYFSEFVPVGGIGARLISIGVIVAIAAINVRGTRNSATMQNWTTGAKVAGLLVLSIGMIALGPTPTVSALVSRGAWPTSITGALLSGIGAAMIGVLWAYEGWQYVTFSAGETRNPQRTFPRAISLATAALVVLYVLANLGYIAALGPQAVAASNRIAADAGISVFGPIAGRIVGLLILISIFSAANGIMLTAPRMYFAMARDGVFFKRLAIVHPRLGTPAFAIIAIAIWAAVLASTGTFEQLLTYVVFTGWIFYGLGALSVFVYRRREPDAPRPFRVPGYPLTPVLFVASAAALVLNTLITQPTRAAAGVIAVLIGTPAFYAWRAGSRRRALALPTAPEL